MNKLLLGVLSIICIAACSGGDTSGIAQDVADAWPAKWCQAEPGITKEQLVAMMGPSTGDSATHVSWSAHQYQFNAFLDPDGSVRQLDINLHSLSDAEKAALQCDTVRTRQEQAELALAVTPARNTPKACALISEAEMSAILAAAVVAEANGDSKCIYKPTAEVSPYVELSVDWGDGAVAMKGLGMAERHEPGLTSPYDGIGDQAAVVGPALMIRTGEDLVTIVLGGVSDAPAAAKKIFDIANPRMGN